MLKMSESSAETAYTRILCHVTFGDRKAIVSTEPEKLLNSIKQKFNIQNFEIYLQIFNLDWNEWIDVAPKDIPNRSKLKVILTGDPNYVAASSASTNEHMEASVAVEGAKVPSSLGHSTKISFSNVNHPLLEKLRCHEDLKGKETQELVSKIFHVISEHENTFFPSTLLLKEWVKKLLKEFPVLKKDGYDKAKGYWMRLLQARFFRHRKEVVEREAKKTKPKVDVATQTDMQVFQDMSPILFSLKQEFQKPNGNKEKIERLMCVTFQYRRGFIINIIPKVVAVRELYPALFSADGIRKEFQRITGKESDKMFFNNLEKYGRIVYDLISNSHTKRVIDLCVKTAKSVKVPYDWKLACLLLLPDLLRENHSFIWFQNQRFDSEQIEPFIKCNATLKTVAEGGGFFEVYAENILLAECNDLAVAVECFLASFFVFMIEYRADTKNTLQLLQSFFFEYDDPDEEELCGRVVNVAATLKEKMRHQNRFVRL